MFKLAWQKMNTPIFRLIGLVALLILGVGILVKATIDYNATLKAQYEGKTVTIETPNPPYQFDFRVNSTSGEFGFGENKVWLEGNIIVDQPEGASYTGASQGSAIINWSLPNGKGFSWIINPNDENLKIRGSTTQQHLQLVVKEVIVR